MPKECNESDGGIYLHIFTLFTLYNIQVSTNKHIADFFLKCFLNLTVALYKMPSVDTCIHKPYTTNMKSVIQILILKFDQCLDSKLFSIVDKFIQAIAFRKVSVREMKSSLHY